MPRSIRVHLEGALYYVTSKANEGMVLFRDRRDYETYLELLKGYQEQYGFKLFAFVLLPEELHLCLELTNDTTISAIMHDIHSRYTKHVAKRYGHTGHLFQERFKLTLAEKAPSLLRLTAFLHRLPERIGAVGDARQYAWSSYLTYLLPAPRSLDQGAARQAGAAEGPSIGPVRCSEVEEIVAVLSREHSGLSYESYVQALSIQEWESLKAQLQQRVVGSPEFVARVEQEERAATRRHAAVPQLEGLSTGAEAPAGGRRGHRSSVMLTASLAVAFLSLCTALLYEKNIASLRQVVRALATERLLTSLHPSSGKEASAQLASLAVPPHLADTVWEIQVRPLVGAGAAAGEFSGMDQLQFDRQTLISREMRGGGFFPSRYTVTQQDGGSALWEAVQVDHSGTMVSWRGECDGQTMHGVFTRQAPGQVGVPFEFIGRIRRNGAGKSTSET